MLEKISNQFNCDQDVTSCTSFVWVMSLLFQYFIIPLEIDQLPFHQELPGYMKTTLHWEHHTCFQVYIPENWIPHVHLGIHFLLLLVPVILFLLDTCAIKMMKCCSCKLLCGNVFSSEGIHRDFVGCIPHHNLT